MGILDFAETVERMPMPIIFVVDTSNYMAGSKIDVLNDTLRKCIDTLKYESVNNTDYQFFIAVINFSTTAEWLYNRFVPIEEFKWIGVSASGAKNIGKAYSKLNEVLSSMRQCITAKAYQAPTIIIMSSEDEPDDDYKPALNALKETNWFKHSVKLAIPIKTNYLVDFTNCQEAIISKEAIIEFVRKLWKRVLVCDSEPMGEWDEQDNSSSKNDDNTYSNIDEWD